MKTKALISCVVTVQLICAFVFAYAKSRFSNDAAHLMIKTDNCCQFPQKALLWVLIRIIETILMSINNMFFMEK